MISPQNNISNIIKNIEQFHTASPIGYIVLDDFIEVKKFHTYDEIIRKQGYSTVTLDIGEERKNKTIFIPGFEMMELYDFFASEEFKKYISNVFRESCKKEFYISQKQIQDRCGEMGLIGQVYEKGDQFGWHVDGYSDGKSLGSFIYYLGGFEKEWKKEYGGVLELGQGDWGNIKNYETILPKKNRIVFLLYSEKAFHRVTENTSNFSRLSIQSTVIRNTP